ncbi:MAG TPA: DUF5050 domain-containing protein [Caldisericia bacterium]|nr:DUF5050 domain-containing protein [Caldisericia bacterium]
MKVKKNPYKQFCLILLFALFLILNVIPVRIHQIQATNTFITGNTNGNLHNWGSLASQGEYIYFSNCTRGCSLFRSKLDGSEYTPLSSSRTVDNINIIGDELLFREQVGIQYLNLNNLDQGHDLSIYSSFDYHWDGEWIYSLSTTSIIKRSLSNIAEKKTVYSVYPSSNQPSTESYTSLLHQLNLAPEGFYFTQAKDDEAFIMFCKRDGTEAKQIGPDPASFLLVEGDWIYYLHSKENNTLYRMKKDGSKKSRLSQLKGIKSINVLDPWVYFSVTETPGQNLPEYTYPTDSFTLYRIHSNGKHLELLASNTDGTIHIAQNHVFYIQNWNWKIFNPMDKSHRNFDALIESKPITQETQTQELDENNQALIPYRNSRGHMSFHENQVYFLYSDGVFSGKIIHKSLITDEEELIKDDALWYDIRYTSQGLLYRQDYVNRDSIYSGTLFLDPWKSAKPRQILDFPASYLVQDPWIYFSTKAQGYQLFKQHLVTGERFGISKDHSYCLNLKGKYLIYARAEDGNVIRVGIDGSDYKVLREGKASDLIIDAVHLYFLNEEKHLYRMDYQRTHEVSLIEEPVRTYNLSENWIYYIPDRLPTEVYRIRKDGTNKSKVTSLYTEDIYTHEDQAYLFSSLTEQGVRGIFQISSEGQISLFYADAKNQVEEIETEVQLLESEINEEISRPESKASSPIQSASSPWAIPFFLVPALILAGIWGILFAKRKKAK